MPIPQEPVIQPVPGNRSAWAGGLDRFHHHTLGPLAGFAEIAVNSQHADHRGAEGAAGIVALLAGFRKRHDGPCRSGLSVFPVEPLGGDRIQEIIGRRMSDRSGIGISQRFRDRLLNEHLGSRYLLIRRFVGRAKRGQWDIDRAAGGQH